MTYVYTPYIIPHTASAAVTIFIIVLMWKRRHLPGARSFIMMMAACHVWLVTNALEIMGQELAIKTFWVNLEYPALVTVTVAWLLAVLQYAGYKRFLNRRSIVVLSIVPMLTVLFLWTNSAHELMRTNIRLDRSGPFVTIAKDYGPWFWVHIAYTYGLMGSATLITLYSLFRYTHLYRGHALAWFAAVIIPSVWNVLYIFRINPLDPLDMTPISFTATGLLMLWGYTRFNLFDIIPTAREQVLQSMEDAVIVLDPFNRIADLNPAALRLLNDPHQQLVGQQSETVFARWPHLVEAYLDTTEARGEITITGPRTTRHYDLQISPLYDQHQRVSGRLIVLRDISSAANARHELQIAKNAIEDQHQRLRQELSLAHDIQLALLPAEPPWQDQRIQSACTIYPAREVGGDFYTFLNGQSAAGVVIGDVSGKGVGAALLMALLLNAVEDCAREATQPAALLALLQQRVGERLQASNMLACVQIVQFDLAQRRVTIANAGMIAPVLLRAGRATLLDVYGLPIGTGISGSYQSTELQLEAADTLVLISDGIVEAHNPTGAMFSFERLLSTLERVADSPPLTIINTLLEAVTVFTDGQQQHDDLTAVVLRV